MRVGWEMENGHELDDIRWLLDGYIICRWCGKSNYYQCDKLKDHCDLGVILERMGGDEVLDLPYDTFMTYRERLEAMANGVEAADKRKIDEVGMWRNPGL